MDDLKIVELYWKRDQSAVSETDIKYGKTLKRISGSILQNPEDSEECVDDTYMKAWDSMPPQRPGKLIAYLGRITRNISINRWHEKHAAKRGGTDMIITELTDCIPSSKSIETEIEAKELTAVITGWLNVLSREERILFLRRYWFGISLNDLAVECSTTPNKLAGRMFRLRESLKTALEKEGVSL